MAAAKNWAHLHCSLANCRMRAEAHVVIPGEKNQIPVQLLFLLTNLTT